MAPRFERFKALLTRLWAHRNALVCILFMAGIAAFLALPFAAQKMSTDEKALIIGAMGLSIADSTHSATSLATQLHNDIHTDLSHLIQRASTLSTFQNKNNQKVSSQLLWHNTSTPHCHAVHATIPSHRGDGTESILLAYPINLSSAATDRETAAAALSAAVGVHTALHLASVTWLAKDVVVVFLEDSGQCSPLDSLEGWLESMDAVDRDGFGVQVVANRERRGAPLLPLGLLQQALIVDIQSRAATEARIGVHGYKGQLPNLDLVALTKRNLEYFTNLKSNVGLDVGSGGGGGILSPVFKSSSSRFSTLLQQMRTTAAFAWHLAAGCPTGAHAALLQRGADALTLSFSSSSSFAPPPSGETPSPSPRDDEVHVTARNALVAVEMIVRTCNNLHERLHHSSAMYLLVSADSFVPIGVYLAPPALLLGALLLQCAVFIQGAAAASNVSGVSFNRGCFIAVALHLLLVLVVQRWIFTSSPVERDAVVDWSTPSILVAFSISLWKSGVLWGSLIFPSRSSKSRSATEEEIYLNSSSSSSSVLPMTMAVLTSLFVVHASGLLLWNWALCFCMLLLAVPVLQLFIYM